MDKIKYETKTLICEFHQLSENEESNFIERAYRLKDDSIIIEYDGNGLSIYGITIGFGKHTRRKGIFNISNSEFEVWKYIRSKRKDGSFIDWQKEFDEMLIEEHENMLKCIGENELPF